MGKARIKLSGVEISKLNEICDSIKSIVEKTKIKMSGPIPIPTKTMRITTRRSPCGDGKASWEKFEMRVHKRLIDIGVDERALRLIMRVPIPKGISIEIVMFD